MIQVRRLGHATLTTPDLERQIAYYTEVVGLTLIERDPKRAYFAPRRAWRRSRSSPARRNALSRLAFQVAPGSDLAALARVLAGEGIKAERRSAISPASPMPSCSRTPRIP